MRSPRPTRQGLAYRGDLHIRSVLLRRSRGRAGKDSTGEKPLQLFRGLRFGRRVGRAGAGVRPFGDALRTDMEYLLLICRLRRKEMELHLKIRRQEEEEDGASLDPEAEE